LELGVGESGVMLEENGADGLLPGEVDQLLVGLDRVGDRRGRREDEGKECDRFDESRAGWGENRVPHSFIGCVGCPHCTEGRG
jgi:hypothetical protein